MPPSKDYTAIAAQIAGATLTEKEKVELTVSLLNLIKFDSEDVDMPSLSKLRTAFHAGEDKKANSQQKWQTYAEKVEATPFGDSGTLKEVIQSFATTAWKMRPN
eukprot:TRINITY_DN116770_c0_g1_i1.p1 TRINITY_DN116770_c0_g1~~TRINITY_DN116770_c0_g1_i1.p1  ORF type:complete len:104 (-),score=3.40 TRINITY_DN116770_c0_g1_i1:358-669(-)